MRTTFWSINSTNRSDVAAKQLLSQHLTAAGLDFDFDDDIFAVRSAILKSSTQIVKAYVMKNKLQHQKTLRGHEDAVLGVISLDSSRLLSWSDDMTLRIWSQNDTSKASILRGHASPSTHALSLPEGFLITSTAYDGSLCVWDAKTGILRRKIMRADLTFMGTAYWYPSHVVSWDLEGNLIAWNIVTGQKISILKKACYGWGRGYMECPFFLLPARDIAVTWASITLRFWDLQTGVLLHNAWEHENGLDGACLMPNGHILTWANDRTLKISTTEAMLLATLSGHEDGIRDALVLDNGDIVSWSSDGTVRIWDATTTQCKCVFVHQNSVLQVLPISTNLLLSQSFSRRNYVWNVWNTETGQRLTTFQSESNDGIVLDSSRFLTFRGPTMKLWDLNSGECVQTLNEHQGNVSGAKLVNPKTVVTWSEDATLSVWEVTS